MNFLNRERTDAAKQIYGACGQDAAEPAGSSALLRKYGRQDPRSKLGRPLPHPWKIHLAVEQYVISVVIDDPGTLQAIALMISSWGYLTELYASAEEFLSAAATSEAACAVIDMDLGEISGVDVAIRLAAMGFKLPIIFITESLDEKHRQQAMDFGGTAFLIKPFPADRLSEAIRRTIGLKLH